MGIRLLDCTLRDGAYVVEAKFGAPTIKGIIKRLQDAGVDIIECGWLKDKAHEEGTSYYHVPEDLCQYLPHKNKDTVYAAMIDWDRYDLAQLPENDGKAIDAIRVVFPHGHFKEGAALAGTIKEKGYKAYLQAANTLAYSDKELTELADLANEAGVEALSIVDTFGAMYGEDLERIAGILDGRLKKGISLGFHSHNNQQLSFALCMEFAKCLEGSGREAVIDASLCGMGRGAGNATTELVANFLNRRYHGDYDMDLIMDTIDIYMKYFQQHPLFSGGYVLHPCK